jgi:lipoprotein-releasing system ATP-binding protein
MPLLARGTARREAMELAANWLREVGLDDRRDHRPGELSGGEQQRVALARALVNNPRLLLADEPTGDLDEGTARQVFELVERIHVEHGLTSILVTHNMDLAARCSRVLRLEQGRLATVSTSSKPQSNPEAENGS